MNEGMSIVHAGLALVDGAFRRDVALLIEGARISDRGTRQSLEAKYPAAPVFGSGNLLMLPGFINSHDHGRALGTASLGVPDDMLEVWLLGLGTLPRISPRLAAEYEGMQLIRSGVTSVAHSHNPATYETMFDEARETLAGYRLAGVRVAMFPPLVDSNLLVYRDQAAFIASLPADLRECALTRAQAPCLGLDDWLTGLQQLFDQYHDPEEFRVHIQASPVGGQWASDALIMRATEWARANGTRVQMHMLESAYQRSYAFRTWGHSFITQLERLGVAGDWLTLAHMVWTEPEDDALLAERGVSVAHNPGSNLRLRSGIAPVARYRQAGVNVGVGMDGHTLDDDQDYLRELRLAHTLANRPGAGAADLLPLDVLAMATRAGAMATFGAEAPLGALDEGWLADLVLLDWQAVRGDWCPPHYPADDYLPDFLLRRASRQHVRHVMVHGEWMLRDGTHTRLDADALNRAVYDELAQQQPPLPHSLGPYMRRFYAAWDIDTTDLA